MPFQRLWAINLLILGGVGTGLQQQKHNTSNAMQRCEGHARLDREGAIPCGLAPSSARPYDALINACHIPSHFKSQVSKPEEFAQTAP